MRTCSHVTPSGGGGWRPSRVTLLEWMRGAGGGSKNVPNPCANAKGRWQNALLVSRGDDLPPYFTRVVALLCASQVPSSGFNLLLVGVAFKGLGSSPKGPPSPAWPPKAPPKTGVFAKPTRQTNQPNQTQARTNPTLNQPSLAPTQP